MINEDAYMPDKLDRLLYAKAHVPIEDIGEIMDEIFEDCMLYHQWVQRQLVAKSRGVVMKIDDEVSGIELELKDGYINGYIDIHVSGAVDDTKFIALYKMLKELCEYEVTLTR